MEQNGGDDRKLPWGVQGKTENVCQEVEKPTDRDHVEGTDSGGLGTACEKSRDGGEEMENICSVYLLRSKMHDHNPFTSQRLFSLSLYLYISFPLIVSSFIPLGRFHSSLIVLLLLPHSVMLQQIENGTQSNP